MKKKRTECLLEKHQHEIAKNVPLIAYIFYERNYAKLRMVMWMEGFFLLEKWIECSAWNDAAVSDGAIEEISF